MFDNIDNTYTSISNTHSNNETLTLEKWQEIIYLIYPKLYYALDNYIEKGFIYICDETDLNPEFIIVHPDNFNEIKQLIKKRTLVNIKNESQEEKNKRLLNSLQKYFDNQIEKIAISFGIPNKYFGGES